MRNFRSIWAFEGDCIFYIRVIFHAASIQLSDLFTVLSDFPFQCCIRRIAILNFLVDLLIQCCIGCLAISDLLVDLLIQRRIGCLAISDLLVDLLIQRRIGCLAISDLCVNPLTQCGVSCFARISFRLDCIFYFFLSRDLSPLEALAVDAISFDAIGFYLRQLGNRAIAIADDITIFNRHAGNVCPTASHMGYLRGCRLQFANSVPICIRLIHGSLDISQCGGHARAIADPLLHRQRVCFDTVHVVQRLAISRESCGLAIQGSDIVFVRSDIAYFEIINQFLNLIFGIGVLSFSVRVQLILYI